MAGGHFRPWDGFPHKKSLDGDPMNGKARSFALRLAFRPGAQALVAQLVEHVLGKDEVGGSNPLEGSTLATIPTLANQQPSTYPSYGKGKV